MRALGNVCRVVVKIGSAVIAGRGRLRPAVIAGLARQVAALRQRDVEVVLVCSGAIAAGYRLMGLPDAPTAVVDRQSAASIGQPRLMANLTRAFSRHRIHLAQLLLSAEDVENRQRFISARHTMQMLLSRGVVPVINENDALSTDQIKVGDNDHLAALVTNVVSADLLVILTVAEGVQVDRGRGPVIRVVEIGSAIDHHIGEGVSEAGTGGMAAKVSAARLASHWGVATIIACGRDENVLPRIVAGEDVGTLFIPGGRRLNARKQWIAMRSRSLGVICVDDGARTAVVERGASLLPAGICSVEGDFLMGARVDLRDARGETFAVGLVSYSAHEIRRLQGRHLREFRSILGYEYVREIVNRDDLVIFHDQGPRREDSSSPRMGTESQAAATSETMDDRAVAALAARAKAAARAVARLDTETKNAVLLEFARRIEEGGQRIRRANEADLSNARSAGLTDAKIRRLALGESAIGQMAAGLRQVARLEDPVGAVTRDDVVPSGLRVAKVRCPLGVVMMIYEARPNVTVDAFALCFKSGNACILKGGREAVESNRTLAEMAVESLSAAAVTPDALILVTTSEREAIKGLLQQHTSIDLVIPRGGRELIEFVHRHSRIATVQHFHGVCHIFVDASADLDRAVDICTTAKTSGPATCNAVEALLIHEAIAAAFVPRLAARLKSEGVEIRGDLEVCRLAPDAVAARDDDWGREFLDLIVACRVVRGLDEAIEHIHQYGSNHTEAILSRDAGNQQRFLDAVQSSCVLVNASTRFNDGFQLGLGAEIGISTSRIHAYGPMGLEELTTQRYVVRGDWQAR